MRLLRDRATGVRAPRCVRQVALEAALAQPGLNHPMLKGRSMGEIAVTYIAAGRRNVGDDLPAEAERAAQQARRATARAAGARAR